MLHVIKMLRFNKMLNDGIEKRENKNLKGEKNMLSLNY